MACIGSMDGTKLAITLWAEPQETQICVQKTNTFSIVYPMYDGVKLRDQCQHLLLMFIDEQH